MRVTCGREGMPDRGIGDVVDAWIAAAPLGDRMQEEIW